jgi:hypothetical protein
VRVLSLSLAGLFLATSVSADPLTISNITGSWQNPILDAETAPTLVVSNQAGSLADEINWGTGVPATGPISGYVLDPRDGSIVDVPLDSVFALADFTHNNFPINPSGFTGVEYDLTFDTNGIPTTLNNVFVFSHNETPNDGDCPVGNVPCADIVTVSQTTFNQIIDVNGEFYFFNLLGFSTDGGQTFSNVYISQENGSNMAVLYATVTATAIPEVPGSEAERGVSASRTVVVAVAHLLAFRAASGVHAGGAIVAGAGGPRCGIADGNAIRFGSTVAVRAVIVSTARRAGGTWWGAPARRVVATIVAGAGAR